MLRAAYQATRGLVLPLQATGTSGMETGLSSLLEPGDEVIIAQSASSASASSRSPAATGPR